MVVGYPNFGRSVLGCIEAESLQSRIHFGAVFEAYNFFMVLFASQTFAGRRCTLQTFSEIVKKFVEIFHNQSVENMALRTNERIGGKKGRLTGCLQDGSLSRKCDERNSPGTVDFPMHPHFPWTTRVLEGDRVSASLLIESVLRKYIDKLDHTLVYKVLLGKS